MVELLYPLFPIASFLGFVVVLIPLPWHLQAWNSGTCFYVFWTSLACLNQFINSVVWANDALNKAPMWCDICESEVPHFTRFSDLQVVATRIMLGAAVGIPASSLCIMRRLHSITKIQAVSLTHAEVCITSSFLSRYTYKVIETTRNHHRFVHLRPLPNTLHGFWFVIPRWETTALLISQKHTSSKVIASTSTSSLGASP